MLKKVFFFLVLLLVLPASFAADPSSVLTHMVTPAPDTDLDTDIHAIQTEWAEIKYLYPKDKQAEAFGDLIGRSEALIVEYCAMAEPLIWTAIAYSSYADAVGRLSSLTKALPAARKALRLLHLAEDYDPEALDGLVLTSLGALYYRVPDWPIGFGDESLARDYLEKAAAMSENGLDAHYFLGDYLIQHKQYKAAIPVLEKALAAPPLHDRPLADRGRRREVSDLLEMARSKVS